MAYKKKEVYKPKPMTEGKRNIIRGLLTEYDIQTAEDIQEALKDLLGGTIKEMIEAEMKYNLLLKALLIIPAINTQQSITEQLKKNNAIKMQSYKGKAVKPL